RSHISSFLSVLPRPPSSPLFPYTTLFRSKGRVPTAEITGRRAGRVSPQVRIHGSTGRRRAAGGGSCGDRLERRRQVVGGRNARLDRKSTRLNSSHVEISYAVFCLKKKKKE